MITQPLPERATLFFEPLDVLHFRDHRPFDAGLHTHARNMFPMPSVFLGCLRTALLRRAGARFECRDFGLTARWARDLLGTHHVPGKLSLRGPFLAQRRPDGRDAPIALFLPCPLDLRAAEKHGPNRAIQRALHPSARRYHGARAEVVEHAVPWSDAPAPRSQQEQEQERRDRAGRSDCDNTPGKGELLSVMGSQCYVNGSAPMAQEFIDTCSLYQREPRVGIVRSDQRLTADDHLLYATEPFRFSDGAGFAVDVELPDSAESRAALEALHHAIVPLGGKGHHARIHYVPLPLDLPPPPEELPASYKLWLLTPLVLGAGSDRRWPEGVTCGATERTIAVGGFDLAKRAPKPLRQALPAGTVLRVHGLDPQLAMQRLAGADADSPSHSSPDRRAGFGVALVAKEASRP